MLDNIAASPDIAAICARHGNAPDALIEILHDVQAALGHVPETALPAIAGALNLSRAEVYGVMSFYHDFRPVPAGGTVVKLCRAEACKSRGVDAMADDVVRRLGLSDGGTASGVTLEAVYCLGNCALAPAAMIEGRLHGRLDADRLAALIEAFSGDAVAGSPQDNATKRMNAASDPNLSDQRSRGEDSTTLTLYVPRDSAARSVGADAVAVALGAEVARRGLDARIVRNGSRGMFWLEPLVEAATPVGRVGFGPAAPEDAPALLDAIVSGTPHPLALGPVEDVPYLKSQQRLTFARVGVTDPLDLSDYEAHGGLQGLRAAHAMAPEDIVAAVTESGLRGRGGAGFPTGIKWKTVAEQPGEEKWVCCNADEGDSGTFADRMLMEGDPFALIEGMAIAGLATGARRGLIYVRSEYPDAIETLSAAIAIMDEAGWLEDFSVAVRRGAGAYICGEESSMLDSLEGKRGQVRAKPPIPAIAGLFGKPTVVNNVLTLGTVPWIIAHGAAYKDFGMGRSRGTQAFQLAGNIARGGLVERGFGLTIRELIEDYGGGTASGRPFRAAQLGGPLGAYVDETMLDVPMDYEALAAAGAMLGHGGVVVFDDTVDMAGMARFAFEFCAIESCGKCTPCRIGAVRGREVMDKIIAGDDPAPQLALIEDLCEVMTDGSLCAMGGLTPMPVQSAIRLFPGDFDRRAIHHGGMR